MPTTIDSLQIEIQSSSTNASAGIRDLAKSLGELKRSGTVTTAIKNLDKLSVSLRGFADASNATRSLGKLAGALERLKSIGSVTSLGSSISKLGASLKAIGDINIDDVAPKIERIAGALQPLSTVKAGGINTMVNGLMKLGKVTESLDEATIDAFADKIKRLTAVLEPLSTKMTTIQNGLRGVNSKARSAGTSVKQMGEKVNGARVNLASFIYSLQTVVQGLQQAIDRFAQFINAAIEWDGVAARFGRGFGAQAQETYDWIKRLNEEMGINIQVFMQYSSIYATMLTGFGVAMEDATKMALGYTELTYDIWAGYNDVYKTFGEAADAVKSAIAGEVEPIRRAGFTIVESTLEQTAANHGLSISLEKATEAQKSYLRYLTLVDQAHSQSLVGTYAKELNTAEGLMRTFSQQLKSLVQAFGSLFLPVLVKVMPYLQAFVELLTDGIQALAALFGITIQGVDWSGYEDGLGGVAGGADDLAGSVGGATEAIKELKNAAIGIDELNVISPTAANAGGAGGSGAGDGGFGNLDIESLWDESIFADINNQVDEIKEKLEDWLPVIGLVGAALGALSITSLLSGLGNAIADTNMLNKVLGSIAIVTIEAALVFKFADDYLETGNLLNLLGEAIVTAAAGYLMFKAWGTGGLILALGVSIAAQLLAIGLNLADGGVEIDDPQLWIQAAFATILAGVAGGFLSYKGFTPLSTGQGVMLGLGVGLTLTLASITMGEYAANGFSATTLLTGLGAVVSGALAGAQGLSYLGVSSGKGLVIGASATVSLMVTVDSVSTLTSADSSTGDKILSALSSAISMGGTGAAIGSVVPGLGTGLGAVIGVGVSLIISGISWLFGGDEGAEVEGPTKEELLADALADLKQRFGDVELTVDELKVLVDNIVAIPGDVSLDFYSDEYGKLSGIEDAIEAALGEIEAYNVKIGLGIEVDQEAYKKTVEGFLTNSQGLLDQYYLTASISLDILGADSSLSESLNMFYTTNSQALSELGGKLKQTISEAFVDGEWIPEKLNEALELQKEIQAILDYVSDVEYRAKLKNVELELSGMNITQESFEDAVAILQDTVTERISQLDVAKEQAIAVAITEFDMHLKEGKSEAEAQAIFDQTVADLQAKYLSEVVEVTYGSVDFGLQTIRDLFSEEISNLDLDFGEEVIFAIGQTMGGAKEKDGVYEGINQIFEDLAYQIDREMRQAIPKDDRGAITSLLNQLTPTIEELEKVARQSYLVGKTVPENARKGLNDAAALAALDGDAKAINYLIGQNFSTDPVFLNTMATVEGVGETIPKEIADGLLTNINFVRDASTGVITGIYDAANDTTYAMTPTLKENLASLGVDLTASLATGVDTGLPDVEGAGAAISNGLLSGAETEMQKQKKSWLDWAIWPWNWFKEKNEIHSPSKLFERGGKHITDGLVKGLSKDSLTKGLSSIWDKAKGWWNNSKGALATYTPAIGDIRDKLSSAWTTAKNWWTTKKGTLATYTPNIGSIRDKVSSAWSSARTWWSTKKSAMSTYTPSIGSIKDRVSSAWTTARNWWSKKSTMSTYTPSIGSIKDKLVSAWNTAKTWWSKNVKLSIPSLSFKVTYSTSGLNTVQKGIVKALGLSGWPKLSFAANGGIFDQGSLIWAGERGAEVVANAGGGRTGVMNVQQMSDAVYEGVYAAVLAAMRAGGGSSGGNQAVNVYVDGRQVTAAVEQRQRERGASIMGSQIYSY